MPAPATIEPLMTEQLPAAMMAFLRSAGECAASDGYRLFLVGGMVRDLLLARPTRDPDLLVQAADPTMDDAPALAAVLATALGGRVLSYSQFGTAKLQVGGFEVDLATARKETYASPGALPDVSPATVEEDMARRDFTVNALAAELAPDNFGALLDLHGGADDLGRGDLAVLHDRSFQDDPTRLLRAVRYEARLGLHMTPECEAFARRDAGYLKGVSGDRVRHELDRIFNEPQPELALVRAGDLGVLEALMPALAWSSDLTAAVYDLREAGHVTTPLLFLALLSLPLTRENSEALMDRLNAPAPWAQVIQNTYTLRVRLPSLAGDHVLPSKVYAGLSGLAAESILAWSALAPNRATRGLLLGFQMKWRTVKPVLTGDDLLTLGVPQGPEVGGLLQELLTARLDGVVTTREDEEVYVRSRIAP